MGSVDYVGGAGMWSGSRMITLNSRGPDPPKKFLNQYFMFSRVARIGAEWKFQIDD